MKARRYAASVVAVAATVAVFHVLLPVNPTTAALSLLLVVLGISARWGLGEATAASLLAVLGFNYFFLPPVGTFTVADPQNWVALLAFLVTAVTASQLAERARRRAAEAEVRRLEIDRLYQLVSSLMLSGSALGAIREFVQRVVRVFGFTDAAFYYRPTGEIVRSQQEAKTPSEHDLLAAAEIADISIDREVGLVIAPVRFGGRPLGSLALAGPPPSEGTARAIVNLAALAIEKARALEEASHAEAARQSEMLKAALLDSLAHDIKTPLTSIKAAVTSMLGQPSGSDRELLTIIDEEADRLNRLAAEVIEMARIEAGKLHLERRAVAAAELIETVLTDLGVARTGRVTSSTAPGLPPADADPEFAAQVLKQLLENALKYTPEGSPISVSAEEKGGKIVIRVADRGPGIEENERLRIFDKFFRGRRHRFEAKGTGMGLAIARGIVEAHGEKIWVESEPGHGSVFSFSLPVHRSEA
jgi:two-component system, OmpR family, sensor histidine kinase KdpD